MKKTKETQSNGSSHPQLANNDELKIVLGRRIAAARKASGLTQKQLSYKIGGHQVTVALWETGKTLPLRPALDLLVVELGISLFELIRAPDPWELP